MAPGNSCGSLCTASVFCPNLIRNENGGYSLVNVRLFCSYLCGFEFWCQPGCDV
jgi:hypothetical protein